jgi:hypothetical protein
MREAASFGGRSILKSVVSAMLPIGAKLPTAISMNEHLVVVVVHCKPARLLTAKTAPYNGYQAWRFVKQRRWVETGIWSWRQIRILDIPNIPSCNPA